MEGSQKKRMPNHDDILRELTFKGDTDEVGRRVYYTITTTPKGSVSSREAQDRVARGFAQLTEVLRANNVISEGDLDNILLKMVGY